MITRNMNPLVAALSGYALGVHRAPRVAPVPDGRAVGASFSTASGRGAMIIMTITIKLIMQLTLISISIE